MNRYELESAVRKVDDYNLRISPCAKPEAEFEKAKAECSRHLSAQLSHVESLTYEQYADTLRIQRHSAQDGSTKTATAEKGGE